MRKNIVAGNWKMNKTFSEAKELMQDLSKWKKENPSNCEVFIAPSALYVSTGAAIFSQGEISVCSQDISTHKSGAFTGEISADMLCSVGAKGALIAHSERRQFHGETDALASEKVKIALENNLVPFYCNGETLEQRKAGKHFEVVAEQTKEALFGLSAEQIKKVVIAYEPVWAIGTGETASSDQAQEIHAHIRSIIAEKYGQEVANEISILYGGSVKPANAKEIFSKPDVDGGLIGGASLSVADFAGIIQAFS